MTKPEARSMADKVLALPEPTRRETLANILILMHDAEVNNRRLREVLEIQANAMSVGVN